MGGFVDNPPDLLRDLQGQSLVHSDTGYAVKVGDTVTSTEPLLIGGGDWRTERPRTHRGIVKGWDTDTSFEGDEYRPTYSGIGTVHVLLDSGETQSFFPHVFGMEFKRRRLEANPPWSNKLIEANRAEIEEAGLPMPTDNELGTGRYGAVYETEDPGVVFKITSDPTEAAFIKRATEIGDWPKGIVRYYAIVDLEGKRYKRETYGIWREASIEVGLRTAQFHGHEYSRREEQDISEFGNYLEHFRNAAAVARDAIKKDPSLLKEALSERAVRWAWDSIGTAEAMPRLASYGMVSRKASDQPLSRYRGYQRIAAALRACGLLAELMEHTDMSSAVGGALGFYLEHNILLADVHADNVGKVVREDPGYADLTYWVITDPGHAVFLDEL